MTQNISGPVDDSKRIRFPAESDQPPEGPQRPSCGDFDIRIRRDGSWTYRNSPIGRKALVKLFSSVLRREPDGEFWLVTPVERCRVAVEDAPFVAVELSVTGAGGGQTLRFRTNLDEWVEAGPDHPIRVDLDPDSGAPRPYIQVGDRLEALILRSVYYELAELGVERAEAGESRFGVWSNRTFFPLGPVE